MAGRCCSIIGMVETASVAPTCRWVTTYHRDLHQEVDLSGRTTEQQPGHAEQRTHDYVRYGTPRCLPPWRRHRERHRLSKNWHRRKEYLAFLKHLARSYPNGELHLVMDNCAPTNASRSAPGKRPIPGSTSASRLPPGHG